jgi:hypothetical protein
MHYIRCIYFLHLFQQNYVIIIVIAECYFYGHICFGKDMLFIPVKHHHIHINSMFLVVFTFCSDHLRHYIDGGAAGKNAAELNIGVRPRHGATFIVSSGLGSENRLVGHESYIVQMEKIRRAALPSRRSATSTSPARSIIPEYGHSSPDSNASSFVERDEQRRHGAGRQ